MKSHVSRMVRRLAAVSLAAALLLPVLGVAPVAATDWGCTPGYWKNHADSWAPTGFSQGQSLASAGFIFPAGLSEYANDSLYDALSYSGGPGVSGAARIMLRAAVASLLNANFGDAHAILVPYVLAQANWALAGGHAYMTDRELLIYAAASFDYNNNQYCPLN